MPRYIYSIYLDGSIMHDNNMVRDLPFQFQQLYIKIFHTSTLAVYIYIYIN